MVVGEGKDDYIYADEAFHMIASSSTELQYIRVDQTATKFVDHNIPYASLKGLRMAFNGDLNETETELWLGKSRNSWKFVYLTEPDSILHTRPHVLHQLRDVVLEGSIAVPHRLQPIPHGNCLLYTSPSPRDVEESRMPSSA